MRAFCREEYEYIMEDLATLSTNGTELLPLKAYTEKAYLAYARYGRAEAAVPATAGGIYRLLLDGYHIDDAYDRLVVRPFTVASDWLARVFDPGVIDGLINGVAKLIRGFSLIWRESQTGNIQHYLIGFLAGTLALLFY